MEHMWVEVWADYFPSRGAKHVMGDTWIPLDASFKQYEYTEGEDIASNVPFDAQALVDDLNSSITVNESEGWVEGMDQSKVEAALSSYQQQIETYINDQNPDATVGDVLGTQKVIVQEFQQLAAGLPYKLVARTHNYSVLPDNLRHKFRYTLGTEVYGRENSRLITFEQSLPELAGKKLAMSFKPATQDDEDLIASYMPAPDPVTGEIDPSQLPNTLPGYLINLTGEFTSNGEVIESAAAGTMGGELYETLALWAPGRGWRSAVNHPIAGEYRAIGLDLQGANAEEAGRLREEMAQTRKIVGSNDAAGINSLSKNQLLGDLMYATIYSYFSTNNEQSMLESDNGNIVSYRLPSFGLFSTVLQTSYWFGIPRNVSSDGLAIDVDMLEVQAVARDNNSQQQIDYIGSVGIRASAMEHVVPQRLWGSEDEPVDGASAVKAIQLALSAGQKVWKVNADNLNFVLSQISVDFDVQSEVRNAVYAGRIVTLHDRPVVYSSSGSSVFGYIIRDPLTGSAAYKISGGLNGGRIDSPSSAFLPFFPVLALTTIVEKFGPVLQKLFDCVVENFGKIVAFIALVLILALLIKLTLIGAGVLGGALILVAANSYASGGSRPNDCGLSCNDHFTNCLSSSIQSQRGPLFGSSACVTCRNQCEQNGGDWPDIARPFSGPAKRCDYWNF